MWSLFQIPLALRDELFRACPKSDSGGWLVPTCCWKKKNKKKYSQQNIWLTHCNKVPSMCVLQFYLLVDHSKDCLSHSEVVRAGQNLMQVCSIQWHDVGVSVERYPCNNRCGVGRIMDHEEKAIFRVSSCEGSYPALKIHYTMFYNVLQIWENI